MSTPPSGTRTKDWQPGDRGPLVLRHSSMHDESCWVVCITCEQARAAHAVGATVYWYSMNFPRAYANEAAEDFIDMPSLIYFLRATRGA